MSRLFILSLALCIVLPSLTVASSCGYDRCKGELSACVKVKDEATCTRSGQLYVSYKTGTLSLGREHVCCNWRLNELNTKYLYCVTKIRTLNKECKDGTEKNYDIKIKTKNDCNKFSCFNK